MLFHRIDFFIFFSIVYLVYVVLTRRAQNVLLLVASYVFYGMWDWRFLGLLFVSTLVDFVVGWVLSTRPKHPRAWLTASIVTNLGILAAFKYAGFFVGTFVALLNEFGLDLTPAVPKFILPVGISFYTFQSMSYTIDVFRGHTQAWRPTDLGPNKWTKVGRTTSHFADFALYVAFFPQLVAGPIERSSRLLKQVLGERRITSDSIGRGCWLFLLGLVMKVAIADEIAPQVDACFADIASRSAVGIYVGTLAFAIQIYCDFAGYSYMARGVANLMGFDLMINFRQPYLARSFSDFWRRWHISLSTWMRDYLYIPLGGNRISSRRTYVNLLSVMTLAGLWHGSTWAFVLWGLLHGAFLTVERRCLPSVTVETGATPTRAFARLSKLLYGLFVFHGVLLGWLLFRIGDLAELGGIWSHVGTPFWSSSLADLPVLFPEALPFLSFAALFLLYELSCWRTNRELFPVDLRIGHRFVLYLSLTIMLLAAGGEKDVPFIYFQF